MYAIRSLVGPVAFRISCPGFVSHAVRGWNRALSPLSDNALWGFIERASNWGVPFALLALQKTQG